MLEFAHAQHVAQLQHRHIVLEAQGTTEPSGVLRATQDRLARLASCSRQSANGLLRELEKQGLIQLAYGRIQVPDARALALFAEE